MELFIIKRYILIWYDSKGYVIDSADISSSNFKVLAPDTIGEAEYHVAKKYARY